MTYDVRREQQPAACESELSLAPGGDISPEGVVYINPAQSPNQRALLLMANEVSGTLGV